MVQLCWELTVGARILDFKMEETWSMNDIRHSFSFTEGRLSVNTPWAVQACGSVKINGESVSESWAVDHDGVFSCTHGSWQLQVRETVADAFALEIRNVSEAPLQLGTVCFARWQPEDFAKPLETSEFREFVHGGSFLGVGAGVKCVGRKTPLLDFANTSSMVTVYQKERGGALLLGVLPPVGEAFSEFSTLHSELHLEGRFGFEINHVFDCLVEPGASQSTSTIIALAGDSGTTLLAAYGQMWNDLLERKPIRKPMIGWNSWDFRAGAVTRQSINENVAAGKKLFGDALEVFAIDEGWECQWGSWEANAKFPEGLQDYCRHVKAEGYMPGVWTAPLLVNTYNPLFFEHPDWFASREDGQLEKELYSYGPMAYLDPTIPEVVEHLKGVFSRLRQAGFEYFKVDFCQCILHARKFSDLHVGRNGLVRRAFKAIREAIGDEAYLLACGAPYESVTGLVDAVRSTGDIHVFWGHVLKNAACVISRWWMQGNLWNCDPDFLVVRGPDTAEPPYVKRGVIQPAGPDGGWMAGRVFNEMEARTYSLVVHLSGGDVVLGDSLDKLNQAGAEMIRRVLTPRENAAVPVDFFESEQDLPRIWISRGSEDTLVGLFNWTDKTARIDFDPARYGLSGEPKDFWTGDRVAEISATMSRRSSMALVFPR